jgi:hypothetical protein
VPPAESRNTLTATRRLSVDLSKDNYFEYTVAIPGAGIEAVGGSRPDIEIVR